MQIEFGAMTEKGREKIIQSGAFLARRLFYSRQGADAPRVGGKVPEIRTSPLPSASWPSIPFESQPIRSGNEE